MVCARSGGKGKDLSERPRDKRAEGALETDLLPRQLKTVVPEGLLTYT